MFYPAHFNLHNRKCLVVGGGTVAERKVVSLLQSGGVVTLISLQTTAFLESLARVGQIIWHSRQFRSGDTSGMFLVCAATDFPEINSFVFEDAYKKNGIRLVNVVDVIHECTFAAASVVICDNVSISISTSGKSPAMSRRIREYLESRFGVSSLYTEESDERRPVPIENRRLPYPVYLLLKGRECVVICASEQTSPEMRRRMSLLEQSGASIARIAPTRVNPHKLSDAFLVLIEPGFEDTNLPNAVLPPREYLGEPQIGEFVTPPLIMDDDLIVSISIQDENPTERNNAQKIHAELVAEFENVGYGAFINFLGSLRPLVLEAIPTQRERQKFFDTLIDCIPHGESGTIAEKRLTCCLGFANLDCSTKCVFNMVRHGQIECAEQYALERIKNESLRYPTETDARGSSR